MPVLLWQSVLLRLCRFSSLSYKMSLISLEIDFCNFLEVALYSSIICCSPSGITLWSIVRVFSLNDLSSCAKYNSWFFNSYDNS
ncbi:unnamed protein product [Moneuplotes crassus]|uniref:Uncharacterized protein n=1 Tax=Euplotes crassus TaxID=5936 RepID=A0AAD2CVB7_EUPCR|nr:unnamed protein product [Moneuplotes crassus]